MTEYNNSLIGIESFAQVCRIGSLSKRRLFFNPNIEQVKFLEALTGNAFHVVGGQDKRQSSKTELLIVYALYRATTTERSNIVIVSHSTWAAIRIMERILHTHDNLPLMARVEIVKKLPDLIEFANGSSVRTASCRSHLDLAGETDCLLLDEVGYWGNKNLVKKLIDTFQLGITDPGKKNWKIAFTTSLPSGEDPRALLPIPVDRLFTCMSVSAEMHPNLITFATNKIVTGSDGLEPFHPTAKQAEMLEVLDNSNYRRIGFLTTKHSGRRLCGMFYVLYIALQKKGECVYVVCNGEKSAQEYMWTLKDLYLRNFTNRGHIVERCTETSMGFGNGSMFRVVTPSTDVLGCSCSVLLFDDISSLTATKEHEEFFHRIIPIVNGKGRLVFLGSPNPEYDETGMAERIYGNCDRVVRCSDADTIRPVVEIVKKYVARKVADAVTGHPDRVSENLRKWVEEEAPGFFEDLKLATGIEDIHVAIEEGTLRCSVSIKPKLNAKCILLTLDTKEQ